MIDPAQIEAWIKVAMPQSHVTVDGDGRHFNATVVSEAFEEMTMLEQHRLVYAALGDKMGDVIHALSLTTLTPEQEAADEDI